MASGVRALGTDREPAAWQAATTAAQGARAVVAGNLADLLVAAAITGGWELITQRVRELGEAKRTSDPMLVRAALANLAVACGSTMVRIDLQQDHPAAYRT